MNRAVGTNNVLGDIRGDIEPITALPTVETFGFQPVYLTSPAVVAVAISPVAGWSLSGERTGPDDKDIHTLVQLNRLF